MERNQQRVGEGIASERGKPRESSIQKNKLRKWFKNV